MTKILYYTTDSKENPVDEFINSLNERQQNKIIRILFNIRDYGLVTAIPHVKKLSGTPLWEIRILGQDNIRVLYVSMELDKVVLLHGFIKKKQKAPLKEITIALNRYKDWISRLNFAT